MAISLLFSGHMIDLPDRAEPRFPPSLENAARMRIARAIEPYASHSGLQMQRPRCDTYPDASLVLGFASGARGGDLLFHEECRRRKIDTVLVLPFEPNVFVKTSVDIRGTDWQARFWDLWNATPMERQHVLELSPAQEGAYAMCNDRLVELARRHGRVHLIAFLDSEEGGRPGGTADLVLKVRTENWVESQTENQEDEPDIFSPQDLQG